MTIHLHLVNGVELYVQPPTSPVCGDEAQEQLSLNLNNLRRMKRVEACNMLWENKHRQKILVAKCLENSNTWETNISLLARYPYQILPVK
jgi:hypothetical protein